MLTQEQYTQARAELDAFNEWAKGRNSWFPHEVPQHLCHVDNAMRTQVEVYEFMNDPPERYFFYINEATRSAVTWMGDRLGDVDFGKSYQDNFGGTRVPVTITGANGVVYYGTYYKSAGQYARAKRRKTK